MGNIGVTQLGNMQYSHVRYSYMWEQVKTSCDPVQHVYTFMSRLHSDWSHFANKETSNVTPKAQIYSLNSWIHVRIRPSICEWSQSSGHLSLTATTVRSVLSLPHMRPCDLQPAECETAPRSPENFRQRSPTGRTCSCLLQRGMIRVARQHIPNCHAAKIPHFNARSCLENTPRTERLSWLS